MYPATVELLAPQPRATVCDTGATPVPLRLTLAGELVALLETVMLPVAGPAVAGANWTLTDAVWFCESVTAPDPLRIEKPVPVMLTPDMATLELPVLVRVRLFEEVLPSFTELKLRLAGETLSVLLAATPVPLKGTFTGEPEALLVIASEPVTVAAVVGAYCTLKFVACEGARFNGKLKPLTLKPAPLTPACEIVRVAVPLLLT